MSKAKIAAIVVGMVFVVLVIVLGAAMAVIGAMKICKDPLSIVGLAIIWFGLFMASVAYIVYGAMNRSKTITQALQEWEQD